MLCQACKARFKRVFGPLLGLVTGAVLFSVPPLLNSQVPLVINVANNRVGVNTPTPSEALEVNGTVKATAFVGNGQGLSGVASGWTKSGTNVNLSETGNVGVGTTTPGQKLDVTGDIRTTTQYRVGAVPGKTSGGPLRTAPASCSESGLSSITITGGIITDYVYDAPEC